MAPVEQGSTDPIDVERLKAIGNSAPGCLTTETGIVWHPANELLGAAKEIEGLQSALNRMVLAHENLSSDTEGKYPTLDAGCIECTAGTVPDRYNTGRCAYHNAKRLLGHDETPPHIERAIASEGGQGG